MDLDGKVVVITGASGGIGAACAAIVSGRGGKLALISRSAERVAGNAPPGSLSISADLGMEEERRVAVERVIAHYGRVDVLINNAGVGLFGLTENASVPDAERLFAVNFFAPLQLSQLCIPHMSAGSCIANVTSVAAKITAPWATLYSASKYALDSLSDGMRVELKPRAIHVMSVCPGYIDTDFQQNAIGTPPQSVSKKGGRSFVTSAEECARGIIRAIERGVRTAVIPGIYWLPIIAGRFFPGLVEAKLQKMLYPEDSNREE